MSSDNNSDSSDSDNPIDAIFEGTKTDRKKERRPKEEEKETGAIVLENSKPTSFRDLPPIPPNSDNTCSVLLFYQYIEPLWTTPQHKRALKTLVNLCHEHAVTGRGRVAPEGLNCTLTGPPAGIRGVCVGLRQFNKIFEETDFKITDLVPLHKQFKSLSVRKTEELVAYGLKGDAVAPSLAQFAGTHLEAPDYHQALQDPEAVVVDVRNFYESRLGSFNPPPNGAKLIDPMLRNSVEFPRWLADPKTQAQFHNKKVLMFCTGGIRCERATALLNQMVATSSTTTTSTDKKPSSANHVTCKPKGVYELRGGIERYVKTYTNGGFWKGKNYLFDRRLEQVPEGRSIEQVEQEIDQAKCCLCRRKWTMYRGQYSCASKPHCGVPVIVCPHCTSTADQSPHLLQCDLCLQKYRPPSAQPDLKGLKRKAEELILTKSVNNTTANTTEDDNDDKPKKKQSRLECYSDRLFVSRLPLTVTVTKLQQALLPSGLLHHEEDILSQFKVHWLTDHRSHAFYGSCMIQMPNADLAAKAVDKATNHRNNQGKLGIRIDQKRIKVSFVRKLVPPQEDHPTSKSKTAATNDVFAPQTFQAKEYPPIAIQ